MANVLKKNRKRVSEKEKTRRNFVFLEFLLYYVNSFKFDDYRHLFQMDYGYSQRMAEYKKLNNY